MTVTMPLSWIMTDQHLQARVASKEEEDVTELRPVHTHPQSYFSRMGVMTHNPAWVYRNLAPRRPRVATDTPWLITRDGDPAFVDLYRGHYSSGAHKGSPLVLGPGEKLALILEHAQAAAGLRHCWFRGEKVIYFAFFRNLQRKYLSSDLILDALRLARARWPGIDVVTIIDPTAVESSNPGFCFQCAGFERDGHTDRHGFRILRRRSDA